MLKSIAEMTLDKFKLTKLEAARRQLRTAIRLWFADEDPVSIYSLAYAAHEVIHTLHKKRGGTHGYVFDSPAFTQKGQDAITRGVKKWGNFLKHANNDPDGEIEFNPHFAELMMLGSVTTLHTLTNEFGTEESGLHSWVLAHSDPSAYQADSENEKIFEWIRRDFPDKKAFWLCWVENWGTRIRWRGGYPKPEGF